MSESINRRIKVCPKCVKEFSCYSGGCWCSELPNIMTLEDGGKCYCPECLKGIIDIKMSESKTSSSGKEELVEDLHYYYNENGNWVFTAYYLQQRGYCCKNGCKHCPYGYRKGS